MCKCVILQEHKLPVICSLSVWALSFALFVCSSDKKPSFHHCSQTKHKSNLPMVSGSSAYHQKFPSTCLRCYGITLSLLDKTGFSKWQWLIQNDLNKTMNKWLITWLTNYIYFAQSFQIVDLGFVCFFKLSVLQNCGWWASQVAIKHYLNSSKAFFRVKFCLPFLADM